MDGSGVRFGYREGAWCGSEVPEYFEHLSHGRNMCRGATSVGCLLSLKPASSRNREGGNTEVMAEVIIVLGIRNAVSQII
jgi:hypothetical protein